MTDILTGSDSFSRPANTDAYSSADLIANSATAGSCVALVIPAAHAGTIRRLRLTKTTATVANAAFRIHLFTSDPFATAPSNADNGAIELNAAHADYLGYVDLAAASAPDIWAAANTAVSAAIAFAYDVPSASFTGLWAVLEARAAYAPGSAEAFTLTAEVEPA